jgi:hypothetical protein
VCLPGFLFREFLQLKGGPEDEARQDVDAWALAIMQGLSDTESFGDPIKFWRARWEQRFPTRRAEPELNTDRMLANLKKRGVL